MPESNKDRWVAITPQPGPAPTLLGLQQEYELGVARKTQLADVRKAAENWRTGLGALLAVLAAVFFVKGRSSFQDIGPALLKLLLAASLLISAAAAVYGAYRALRAAYGLPSDEYTGNEGSPAMMRLDRLQERFVRGRFWSPGSPERYATVGAWRFALARLAVSDLRHAKVATIISLVAFAIAAAITWFAPA